MLGADEIPNVPYAVAFAVANRTFGLALLTIPVLKRHALVPRSPVCICRSQVR